jgi:undecaprenyl-diphosphatase
MNRSILILLGCFAVWSVAVAAGWAVPVDAAAMNAMAGIRTPVLTEVATNFTALGSAPVVSVAMLLAVLYCLASARPRYALAMLWTPAAFLSCELVKLIVHRPRPAQALIVVPTSFAFPSGHTAAATALFVTLALLAAAGERRAGPHRLLIGSGIGIAVLVGWSRVYLGVHYFSDVVGGFLLGAGGAVAATLVIRRAGRGSGQRSTNTSYQSGR